MILLDSVEGVSESEIRLPGVDEPVSNGGNKRAISNTIYTYYANFVVHFLDDVIRKKLPRTLQIENHKRYIAKQSVEQGKAHITKSGKEIFEKIFKPQFTCKCSKNCPQKIDVNRQKEIFDSYYNEYDWSQKTLFIRSNVIGREVKYRKSDLFPIIPKKIKNFTFEYRLIDSNNISQRVCREFYLNCIQITATRVSNAMRTKLTNPTAIDNRGKGESANKTSANDKLGVRKFIETIPGYETHFNRKQSQKIKSKSNLTVIELYREYKSLMESRHQNSVSEHIFRYILKNDEPEPAKSTKKATKKFFKPQDTCKCSKNCTQKINVDRQQEIFDKYYTEFNVTQQTWFLRSAIISKESPSTSKARNYTFDYTLTDSNGVWKFVCRNFFLNCIQITSSRISLALKSRLTNPNATDKRGKLSSKKSNK